MKIESWDFKGGIKCRLGKVIVKDDLRTVQVAVQNKERIVIFEVENFREAMKLANLFGFGDKEYRKYLQQVLEVF